MKVLILCVIFLAAHAQPPDIDSRACFTEWFDRDDPTGTGDYETLAYLRKEFPEKICDKPLNIQARTLSGVPAQSTGQVFELNNAVSGFACMNDQQPDGKPCLDYKVRFKCKCPWPHLPDDPVA